MDLADRDGVEVVVLLAPHLAPRDEVRGLEHSEMLHDPEPRELGDDRTQLAEGEPLLLDESIEQSPARGLGERSEHLVHETIKGDSRVTCQRVVRPTRRSFGSRAMPLRLSSHVAEPTG